MGAYMEAKIGEGCEWIDNLYRNLNNSLNQEGTLGDSQNPKDPKVELEEELEKYSNCPQIQDLLD